jgi:transcriptional regulator with XRE-family HTH domain
VTQLINLIAVRRYKNLSYAGLAKLLKVTPEYVSYIEKGKKGGSIELWDRMEIIFGIPQQILRIKVPKKEFLGLNSPK